MPSAAQPPSDARSRSIWLAAALSLLLISVAGCEPRLGPQPYGRAFGADPERSMNGVTVLARMIEERGNRVATWERLSPRLNRAHCLIWFPDHFGPPRKNEAAWFEDWLRMGNRTLVYVGRDYDATIGYWEAMLGQASPEQAPELRRRLAHARAEHERRRSTMPADQRDRWFHVRRDQPQRRIRSLTSPQGWADGVDPTKIDLRLEARLDPLQPRATGDVEAPDATTETNATAQTNAAPPALPTSATDDLSYLDGDYSGVLRGDPPTAEVLLASQGDALVTRLRHPLWPTSQIIIVANGSFLLNLPLVNREHRKLAAHLIDTALAPPGLVVSPGSQPNPNNFEFVFLEGDAYLPIRTSEPSPKSLSGMEFLQRWPLAPLSVHLLLALMLACFVFFPIFGRPRELRDEALSDFGRHVDELGRLLEKTNDVPFARGRLDYYFGGGRRDSAARPQTSSKPESKSSS